MNVSFYFFVRYININAFFCIYHCLVFWYRPIVCVCVRALARTSERMDTVTIFFHCYFMVLHST